MPVATSDVPAQRVVWRPNPGPQTRFLASRADEVLFGGASGGGKSAAIIAMGLRWVNVPQFRALVLRRESTQLQDLIDKSWALYPKTFPGAKYNANEHTWTFPSGARIRFNHCKEESDKYDYQGQEYQLLIYDELTHFTVTQYLEIASRLRSATSGLPRYLRSTSNPGGAGHEWVRHRFGAWLDPGFQAEGLSPRTTEDGRPAPPALPGQVLWILPRNGAEVYVPPGTPGAKSRQFIPALLKDNPKLLEQDPDYARRLDDLDPVRRAQLKDGDWLATPAAGLYFRRGWVGWLDAPPPGLRWVRAWDLAATPKTADNDPAWTAGVKMARWIRPEGEVYVIADVRRTRSGPGERDAFIFETAESDGRACRISLPQDPGQAGVDQVAAFKRLLAGYSATFVRPAGDKVERFGPFSAQAAPPLSRVLLVRGMWNDAYCGELEEFPDGKKKDQADATSDAFAIVASDPRPTAKPAGASGARRGMEGW